MSERPVCSCDECLARTARLLSTPAPRRTQGPRPTVAQLEKHAKRFGPEQVAETAAELGVTVEVERRLVQPRARRGPTLKQRVASYVADGYTVDIIAELENLTPARARALVAEARR